MTTTRKKEKEYVDSKLNMELPIIEEFPKIINEVEDSTNQLIILIDNLKEQLRSGNLDSVGGISLLDVKNQLMMHYLMNVAYVVAKKCHGRSIDGDACIERLVEIRTVLERIRPLEHKLKYMMEKLIKTALTGVRDENDPAHYRANPEDMVDNSDSESDTNEKKTENISQKKSGVYVPPKVAPVFYDNEDNQEALRQKKIDRAKKRALHSSVVEELKEEYLDTPAEVSHCNVLNASITKHQKLKNQYEEEYLTRLPSSKKLKHRGRHSMAMGNVGERLTHFEDIKVLEDESAFTAPSKRKSAGKSNKNKGFKRRRTQ